MTSQKLNLGNIDTKPPEGMDKKQMKKKTKELAKEIAVLQEQFYANHDRSMLVVLQGMDSSGKDGTTREIFRYASPNGVKAISYKKPTEEEFGHDFLWRIHKNTPKKGHIHVFNRSHYEDILIQYVHDWIDDEKRDERMAAINAFEHLLVTDAKTIIVKLYLHLSNERQKEKLEERKLEEDKFWKHNPGDWDERKHWDDYREAYQYVLDNSQYPWTVVPADSRTYRNYVATKKIHEILTDLNMTWPPLQTS